MAGVLIFGTDFILAKEKKNIPEINISVFTLLDYILVDTDNIFLESVLFDINVSDFMLMRVHVLKRHTGS